MEFGYSRVDFLPLNGADCVFCHRHLRSAKGIVVIDHLGVEYFAGPSCAKRELGNPDERILDVARLALLVVAEEVANKVSKTPIDNSASPGADLPDKPKASPASLPIIAPEVQYLRLRYEAMGRFKGNVSQVMRAAYATLQDQGELDVHSSRLLTSLIRKSGAENTIYSDRNIRRCIGVEHWLLVALEQTKPDRRTYLNLMLDKLHNGWMLTEGQLSGINRWGEGVRRVTHDFPVLDVRVFVGVTKPDFLIRPKPRP